VNTFTGNAAVYPWRWRRFVLGMILFSLFTYPPLPRKLPQYDDYLSLMPLGFLVLDGASHPLEKSWAPLLGMDSGFVS